MFLVGGSLVDWNTGALSGRFGVPGALGNLTAWSPQENLALLTGYGGNNSSAAILQVFPAQVLTRPDETCTMPFSEAVWVVDPRHEGVFAYGRSGGYGSCAFDQTGEAWGARGEVVQPSTDATQPDVSQAAWSPNGETFLRVGVGGVQLRDRR